MLLIVILFCTAIEQFAVIERYTLLARVPGVAMNIALLVLAPVFAWPLKQCWSALGITPLVTIPLWQWLSPLGPVGYGLEVFAIVLLMDFLIYWRHRAEHKWLWPIHAVHHSPTELHAANDIGHPAQIWADVLFVSLPLSLVQVDGLATPVAVSLLISALSYYIHSPINLHFGRLRMVLVDNRFHRVHHSIEPRHFDKNFGICFSVWDRIFGTAYDPMPDEWPEVGIVDAPAPKGVVEMLLLPIGLVRRRFSRLAPESSCQEGASIYAPE